jgi:hypothetical protein
MQPLRPAADPEAGFIPVLDRRHRDQVAHGIDEARVARGALATDPRVLPHFAWIVPELHRHLDWATDTPILSGE